MQGSNLSLIFITSISLLSKRSFPLIKHEKNTPVITITVMTKEVSVILNIYQKIRVRFYLLHRLLRTTTASMLRIELFNLVLRILSSFRTNPSLHEVLHSLRDCSALHAGIL